MGKAKDFIDEVTKFGDIDSLLKEVINNTIHKIKILSTNNGVDLMDKLDKVVKKVNKNLEAILKKKNSNAKVIFDFPYVYVREDFSAFKKKYFKLIQELIKELKGMKREHKWIDIKKIITPLLKLEI